MSVLVTGSIAIDHIMVFQDRFQNHILPDKVHILNVSFQVPTLEKRWGGCGANIAYNLRLLDEDPILLGTVGSDFGDYAAWLDENGIRRDQVAVLDDALTAQCFITTDLDDNQITAFHPGAMNRAHEAPVAGVEAPLTAAIVGPNGKQGMVEHVAALRERGVPCVFDPGQSLILFDGPELLSLMEGAAVYVVNDYEWAVTLERTGLSEEALAERIGALVVTRGEKGSTVRRGGREAGLRLDADRTEIRAVEAERVVDPTGCGDAYRAGLLYALSHGLPLETGARLGSLLGALKVAEPGPQSIRITPSALRERFEREFGEALD